MPPYRLIVVHIGSENRFLLGAELVFLIGLPTGISYLYEFANFEKLISEKVILELSPKCTVAMENIPYHSRQNHQHKMRWLVG